MKTETKKHIIVMIQSLAPFILVLVISFAIWNLLFCFLVFPYQKEYGPINQRAYSYCIESNTFYEDYPSVLWKLDNIVSFSNEKGKVYNINTYVQINDLSIYDFALNSGEVAISEKMAKELNLKVGDSIRADISIYDSPQIYTVKTIFPYSSDLYNSLENFDFSVAIIYHEKEIINNAKGKYIYFLNDVEYDEYMDRKGSYSSRYNLNIEKKSFFKQIFIRTILMNVFLTIVCGIFALLVHNEIIKEIDKYYREGYSRNKLAFLNRIDHVIFLGIPFIIQFVFEIIFLDRIMMIVSCSIIEMVVILVVSLLLCISSEVKYGKAH